MRLDHFEGPSMFSSPRMASPAPLGPWLPSSRPVSPHLEFCHLDLSQTRSRLLMCTGSIPDSGCQHSSSRRLLPSTFTAHFASHHTPSKNTATTDMVPAPQPLPSRCPGSPQQKAVSWGWSLDTFATRSQAHLLSCQVSSATGSLSRLQPVFLVCGSCITREDRPLTFHEKPQVGLHKAIAPAQCFGAVAQRSRPSLVATR